MIIFGATSYKLAWRAELALGRWTPGWSIAWVRADNWREAIIKLRVQLDRHGYRGWNVVRRARLNEAPAHEHQIDLIIMPCAWEELWFGRYNTRHIQKVQSGEKANEADG